MNVQDFLLINNMMNAGQEGIMVFYVCEQTLSSPQQELPSQSFKLWFIFVCC